MANTVHGPYTATAWSGSTGINITRLDNLETAADIGVHSLNPNLSGPYVHSGIACAKDGTVANQLDIASGVAFVTAADGTTIQIDVAADNTHTTSTPSTTYYLYLQPDGTWYWSTSNSPAANSLPICTVATDGSGNISSVTDLRQTAGHPGATLIVARALGVAVTSTADQQILSYAPPVEGIYRASMTITYRNATPQKVIARLDWGNPTLGSLVTNYFRDGWDNQWLNGAQTNVAGNNQGLACEPLTVHAVHTPPLNMNIVIHFQDPGGTPNDVVSAVIERLA